MIAQIGTGGWGKNHTRVLSQMNKLTAVCDLNADRSKYYGEMYEVNHYSSITDLLKNEDFDGVIICTPTSTHFDVASEVINAGKAAFVEKPMTYRSAEGKSLIKKAEEKEVLLTCGYIERFNPAVSHVKNYVENKKYGELLMVEFHRESRMPMHIKDVGIIYDTSVHDIDTALWLFGEKPQTVYARAGQHHHEHEDFATIMLSFNENRTAIITSNWITPAKKRKFSSVFTEARINSDFITQKIEIDTADGTYIPRINNEEPLFLEIKNFVESVEGSANLRVTPEDALLVTQIAEAAIDSSRSGTPVNLN